ncbi:hypothetical protein KYJ26_16760 [Bacillus sp. MCCB 382]|uniref:hypothetical protein n=1 Tax=Bacillus sp. MCCB 382 TaxID=2860197 RepID=UPI001C5A03A2|nr:hypothetical protein [Bacillus sp. MCCB 382]
MEDVREIDGKFYIAFDLHRELYQDLYEIMASDHEELTELRKEVVRLRRLERRQQRRYEKQKEESDGNK